jgi:hypothetical protein
MALGDVDGRLECRRYRPVNGKKTDEGPEKQTGVYKNADPKDVQPMNHFPFWGIITVRIRGQLKTPFETGSTACPVALAGLFPPAINQGQ